MNQRWDQSLVDLPIHGQNQRFDYHPYRRSTQVCNTSINGERNGVPGSVPTDGCFLLAIHPEDQLVVARSLNFPTKRSLNGPQSQN